MSKVTSQISMSLDGYVAGPDPSLEDPLGIRGEDLHTWMFEAAREGRAEDQRLRAEISAGVGAYVMGRKMFDGGEGPLDESWHGWWGEDPPYHVPVFVLTHHPRESLPMQGGTTFHFVTEGFDAALAQARAAAGDRDVHVCGGASAVQQALRAGQLDELFLHTTPIFLGGGTRLFEDVADPRLEVIETIHSPATTHVRYRVVR
ncbi:dihydrofolate reductase family protein [Conexibacter stalactiti]|uniref:Dihydrofolate reductase family protein n=1 Tax=Conexibacter stalactiti TaxID=1940611 RepID=A0ABU4HN47_9ACTN|nr:dihydrofolate reductase family protein [Conexibacter stalactiti]MDW5594741.1 dihydrofolate reductase family protein [Conexibacter stalactiti]MEC5035383.1 dihydrofolate reductase family protein [Conexibacter stalactiti]